MTVRRAAELRGRAGEQFGVRIDLGVDLQTDDHFPIAGGALMSFEGSTGAFDGAVSTATAGAGKPPARLSSVASRAFALSDQMPEANALNTELARNVSRPARIKSSTCPCGSWKRVRNGFEHCGTRRI